MKGFSCVLKTWPVWAETVTVFWNPTGKRPSKRFSFTPCTSNTGWLFTIVRPMIVVAEPEDVVVDWDKTFERILL